MVGAAPDCPPTPQPSNRHRDLRHSISQNTPLAPPFPRHGDQSLPATRSSCAAAQFHRIRPWQNFPAAPFRGPPSCSDAASAPSPSGERIFRIFNVVFHIRVPDQGSFALRAPLPRGMMMPEAARAFPAQDHHQRAPRTSLRRRGESLCRWHGTGEDMLRNRTPRRRRPSQPHIRSAPAFPEIRTTRSAWSCSTTSCARSPERPRAATMPPIPTDPD